MNEVYDEIKATPTPDLLAQEWDLQVRKYQLREDLEVVEKTQRMVSDELAKRAQATSRKR